MQLRQQTRCGLRDVHWCLIRVVCGVVQQKPEGEGQVGIKEALSVAELSQSGGRMCKMRERERQKCLNAGERVSVGGRRVECKKVGCDREIIDRTESWRKRKGILFSGGRWGTSFIVAGNGKLQEFLFLMISIFFGK